MIAFLLGFVSLVLPSPAATTVQSQSPFDHSEFEQLLQQHVSDDGSVDYDAFERAPEFRTYLSNLADADLADLSYHEQLALWINADNAYTIELINRPPGPAREPLESGVFEIQYTDYDWTLNAR